MTNKIFELPIRKNYIDNWGVPQALVEIYANAKDSAESPENFGVEYKNSVVTIWNTSALKLEPSTLVLGSEAKNEKDKNIGQFGEGYKLGLVVFLREELQVRIENMSEVWWPSFRESKNFKTEVLHIETHLSTDVASDKIRFVITGVKEEDFKAFMGRIMDKSLLKVVKEADGYTLYDNSTMTDVLQKERALLEVDIQKYRFNEEHRELYVKLLESRTNIDRRIVETSSVYVGGIRVQGFTTGYSVDISPDRVKLSRDRDTISGESAILRKAKAITYARKEEDLATYELVALLEAETSDSGKIPKKIKDKALANFLRNIKVPEGTTTLYRVNGGNIKKKAAKLGIKLPENIVDSDYQIETICGYLEIDLIDYTHSLLTNNYKHVFAEQVQEIMPLLMKDGNEKILKTLNILRTLMPENDEDEWL